MQSVEPRPSVHPFIHYLGGLSRGDLAALRRSAAHLPGFDAGAARVVYPRIPEVSPGGEAPYFAIAALFALKPGRKNSPNARNLGWSARFLALNRSSDAKPADSVARRFERVLGASGAELPRLLRDFVPLIDTSDAPIDFTLLLKHHRSWDSVDRWVQRKWARSFWTPTYDKDEEKSERTS
ncbi:MAG: type I-E CRISPR-associated protein Cse2/CasB [Gammaproteobacteria bacterium]|nr:type I-E CRISPR-associated protein Cse2/CasB [Gammaproteobacteria bacterium]